MGAKWHKAPHSTQWGEGMVVTDVGLSKDSTLTMYCAEEDIPLADELFNIASFSLNQYQNEAMMFRLETATPLYAVLNLTGEVGELCSLLAKGIRDGAKMDHQQNIKKELGDALWSIAAIALDNGFTLEDIAASNINKLSGRKINNTLQGSGDNR